MLKCFFFPSSPVKSSLVKQGGPFSTNLVSMSAMNNLRLLRNETAYHEYRSSRKRSEIQINLKKVVVTRAGRLRE